MNITQFFTRNKELRSVKKLRKLPIGETLFKYRESESRFGVRNEMFLISKKIKPFEKISFKIKNVDFDLIYCPPSFISKKDTSNKKNVSKIQEGFLLGETEVTQALYKAVTGYNPSRFNPDMDDKFRNTFLMQPVEQVTLYDAVCFCNRLSEMIGLSPYYDIDEIEWHSDVGKDILKANIQCNVLSNGFRLPTEWEWEYAARAGTNNKWSGCTETGNIFSDTKELLKFAVFGKGFFGNESHTKPVKSLAPNEWGFYDMTGNVEEWCWRTSENARHPQGAIYEYDHPIKGGGYHTPPQNCHNDASPKEHPRKSQSTIGFRIAMNVPYFLNHKEKQR